MFIVIFVYYVFQLDSKGAWSKTLYDSNIIIKVMFSLIKTCDSKFVPTLETQLKVKRKST